jgi:hypothetical protein
MWYITFLLIMDHIYDSGTKDYNRAEKFQTPNNITFYVLTVLYVLFIIIPKCLPSY